MVNFEQFSHASWTLCENTLYQEGTEMRSYRIFTKALLMAVLGASLLLGACGKKLPAPDPKTPIEKVAVLPLRNNTAPLYAPDWIREPFSDAAPRRYYSA